MYDDDSEDDNDDYDYDDDGDADVTTWARTARGWALQRSQRTATH